MNNDALYVIDVENGFTILCPKELPAQGALEIVPNVNELLKLPFRHKAATLDWHHPLHCSFFGQQFNSHPPHCVAGTTGSQFVPGLNSDAFHVIWRKGYEQDKLAYSAIEQHPYIPKMLLAAGIKRLFLSGYVTNMCVLDFGIDFIKAMGQEIEVYIVEDASIGLDIPELGIDQKEGKQRGMAAGIKYISLQQAQEMVKG